MDLTGRQLIGASRSQEGGEVFTAVNPTAGEVLAPEFRDATRSEIDAAMQLASDAHPAFEMEGRERRAALLEGVAAAIEALGEPLLRRASDETALPLARLEGERGRTCGQLRLFAGVVREGNYLDLRIDHAERDRKPIPKPDLRSMQRAVGPVVVFGASNFPLAFSVAGGDTASALAAGCPIVVKAHPNHPGTSEMIGRVLGGVVGELGLPEGVFSMVHGRGNRVGEALVAHAETRAVGFTGSFGGGRALFDIAAARPVPIPVFAEMGSTNPIFLFSHALSESGTEIATGLAASVTLGVGQFCTNPGLVIAPKGAPTNAFVEALAGSLEQVAEGTMLHAGIRQGFDRRMAEVTSIDGVELVFAGRPRVGACAVQAALLATDAKVFLQHATMHDEVFGPSTLVVRCDGIAEMRAVAAHLPGQLTATVHAAPDDGADLDAIMPIIEQRAGRVLFGGFPTGVEVCHAM
ncbi:MAG: aldehyde dehydrogenase (NADP(+)), partial [Gemmatimonadales bacterium]|nr:aldehyde dehydrogenase (NADP(+)) [Gemmatimonadales bacterium]